MRELRRLLGYLGPYRRDLLIAAVMIILETPNKALLAKRILLCSLFAGKETG